MKFPENHQDLYLYKREVSVEILSVKNSRNYKLQLTVRLKFDPF